MAIRMHFPADVNPEPDAAYPRSSDAAFPFNPHLSAPAMRRPASSSIVLLATLMAAITLALSSYSKEIAAAWWCPGMTTVWLSESTVHCRKTSP